MGKVTNYDDIELYTLMNRPWEIADRPYLLFTAYALSCLSEALGDDDEDCETEIWGKSIPVKILKSIVSSSVENFNEAAANGTKIDIWGRAYSVRKAKLYDPKELYAVFQFKMCDGEYYIEKGGIVRLGDEQQEDFYNDRERLTKNKDFLRKVIMIAEDGDDGWDKLTDMEVVAYCWAQHYNKCHDGELTRFYREYKDYIYPRKSAIFSCIHERSMKHGKPATIYAFDYERVMKWNRENNQPSVVDEVSGEDAYNYWYETAIKKSFKPAQ